MTTETSQVAPKPAPGTPEYNAAMAALYENQGGAKPDTDTQSFKPTRPEWVEEQFWDAEKGVVDTEKLAKSYGELRKKMSAEGAPKETQGATPKTDDTSAAESAVKAAGLDFDQLGSKISTKGDIEEADYEALEKIGLPKSEVQNYVRLVKAEAERVRQEAFKAVGGEANFNAIMEKAKSLPQAEKDAINAMLRAEGTRMAALETLKNRFLPSDGEPQGALEAGAPAGGLSGFASLAQQTEAINDPRYKKDPAYRAQVRQRIALSRF